MLSHEPKNYALLGYDGALHLRGVAFRSSRTEPYGEAFLRHAIRRLLTGDVAGVREEYLAAAGALVRRELTARDVSSRVRLTKAPADYLGSRERRREASYEAMLTSGLPRWSAGDRVRFYRTTAGGLGVVIEPDGDEQAEGTDRRDYDVDYYLHLLRHTFAARLARAFTPRDHATVFADPDQRSLFDQSLAEVRTVLTTVEGPPG
jgi:DNA polymerase elongation subunit (family B)